MYSPLQLNFPKQENNQSTTFIQVQIIIFNINDELKSEDFSDNDIVDAEIPLSYTSPAYFKSKRKLPGIAANECVIFPEDYRLLKIHSTPLQTRPKENSVPKEKESVSSQFIFKTDKTTIYTYSNSEKDQILKTGRIFGFRSKAINKLISSKSKFSRSISTKGYTLIRKPL